MDIIISSLMNPSMILRLQIFLIVAESVTGVPEIACNRLKIGENWYDRNTIWANIGRPYNLIVHRSSNILFFSYSYPEIYSDLEFQLAYLNMDTKECQTIAGIKGGCSVAIDQVNDDIFLGGTDGIYKYNMHTKLADFYKEKGKNVWSLFFKKNLFYISYPDQRLYIEYDGKFASVKEFENFEIDHFHVSTLNEIYFANKTGLYKYNNDKRDTQVVTELITVRQIVEDNEGDTYIVSNFGVFVDGKFEGLKKILDMKNVYGLAFDKDNNFIYSDDKNIIKLVLSLVGCDQKKKHW